MSGEEDVTEQQEMAVHFQLAMSLIGTNKLANITTFTIVSSWHAAAETFKDQPTKANKGNGKTRQSSTGSHGACLPEVLNLLQRQPESRMSCLITLIVQ
jgi:hypothetical protein